MTRQYRWCAADDDEEEEEDKEDADDDDDDDDDDEIEDWWLMIDVRIDHQAIWPESFIPVVLQSNKTN